MEHCVSTGGFPEGAAEKDGSWGNVQPQSEGRCRKYGIPLNRKTSGAVNAYAADQAKSTGDNKKHSGNG